MAQGALVLFEEFSLEIADGVFDLDTDSFKLHLLTTIPTAATASPTLSDFTEVSGGTYAAQSLTVTWLEAAGVATFDATGSPACTFAQDAASGPTDIKGGLICRVGGSVEALGYVDMTVDGGTTPISMKAGDITWEPNASGIFTLS